jgi:hypothetical protein
MKSSLKLDPSVRIVLVGTGFIVLGVAIATIEYVFQFEFLCLLPIVAFVIVGIVLVVDALWRMGRKRP